MHTEPDSPLSHLSQDAMRRLVAWLSLPDRDRAELLNGRIIYKVMPTIDHGDAAGAIFAQLDRFRGPPPEGGGWWLSQEADLYLLRRTRDQDGQGVRPDLVGWRIDKHPQPPRKVNVGNHLGVYVTPPDWVCEVLSPSTRARDVANGEKGRAYHEAGVAHYWLVDLEEESLTVYRHAPGGYDAIEIAGRDTEKALPPFETVRLTTRRIYVLARAIKAAGH